MSRCNVIFAFSLVAALSSTALTPARAQHYDHGPDLHGHDFGHLGPRDRDVWRHGDWVHDWHDGRYGWWWRAGGFWYFYPEPVYPYPTYIPPAVIVQQPPPVPQGLPPAQSWYYCDNPAGYYPYVASCNGPWRQVPATPPGAPSP